MFTPALSKSFLKFSGTLFIAFSIFSLSAPAQNSTSNNSSYPLAGLFYMEESNLVFDRQGAGLTALWKKERRTYVPLQKISPRLIQAVIATEDRHFFGHSGYDLEGMLRAGWKNLVAGKIKQGGSTLTQQLVKNTFLTPERTYQRKLDELWMAMEVEKALPKNQILELYLNRIYWGGGYYGVESASQGYFGKHAADLNLAEAALLAGLIQAPSAYCPQTNPEAALRRRNLVLGGMAENGYITPAQAASAQSSPLGLRPKFDEEYLTGYIIQAIRAELAQRVGQGTIEAGGLRVYCTIDSGMQMAAAESLEAGLAGIEQAPQFHHASRKFWERNHSRNPTAHPDYLQGALVALEVRTGEIRAWAGGRNYAESHYDRIREARRQPGSAFKPVVYAAALQSGLTPATLIMDDTLSIETAQGLYQPENAEEEHLGAVTLRRALAESLNSVAVQLGQRLTIPTILGEAKLLGITSPLPEVASLPLGTGELSLLELVRAYGVFPNQGQLAQPVLIRKVTNRDGKVLYENPLRITQAIPADVACLMTSMMESVISEGTGKSSRTLGFTRPAAGKTGTTSQYRDAWFVGFTPDLIAGVWAGYDQPREIMTGGYGAVVALPIWTAFMKQATAKAGDDLFPVPAEVLQIPICPQTGLLPGPLCSPMQEFFLPGTAPTAHCNGRHSLLENAGKTESPYHTIH